MGRLESSRLAEGIDTGFRLGRGLIEFRSLEGKPSLIYSNKRVCLGCDLEFKDPTLALFSFNHPLGACVVCQGFGQEAVLDWRKVLPNKKASLSSKGVSIWNFGQHAKMYSVAAKSAKVRDLSLSKPFSEYSEEEMNWLAKGDGESFFGVDAYYDWLGTQKHKMHYRIHAARYRCYVTCSACKGDRLNPTALAYKVKDRSISEWTAYSVLELSEKLKELAAHEHLLPSDQLPALQEALSEIDARLSYLREVGLAYLSLRRLTRSLSGGEQQRVHLSRCLGSALTDTLYCLDEPSAGLHAHDCSRLLGVISQLKALGNTIVMVEHEKQMIDAADEKIEIGPGAGHLGGHILEKAQASVVWPFQTIEGRATIALRSFETSGCIDK